MLSYIIRIIPRTRAASRRARCGAAFSRCRVIQNLPSRGITPNAIGSTVAPVESVTGSVIEDRVKSASVSVMEWLF